MLKILCVLATPMDFKNGCWWHRIYQPSQQLSIKGHEVKSIVLGKSTGKEWMEWPDIVWFSRFYKQDPMPLVRAYHRLGKKVVYEIDDYIWGMDRSNPAIAYEEAMKKGATEMLMEADLVITTTPRLKEALSRITDKKIIIYPNSIDFGLYYGSGRENKRLRIGWSGGASHYKDLDLILDVIKDLKKEYDFDFFVQGISGQPLIVEEYDYTVFKKMGIREDLQEFWEYGLKVLRKIKSIQHEEIPFYPPELHPDVYRTMNLDIGLAPLVDNTFNQYKSCIKFYEYASVGAVTLASNVLPYSEEVNYLAKNIYKDWYKKLERLIVDKKFREKIFQQQSDWVAGNRDITKTIDILDKEFTNLWN